MIIVLLGPPGVGKGTQSRRICRQYSIPHVSTGELLREAIRAGTDLGAEVATYIHRGQLVPDKIVVDLVAAYLSGRPEGCLLDGFPRTIEQADALEQYLAQLGTRVTVVIELKVEPKEIERRLLERAQIEGRKDDTPQAIVKRMEVYQQRTQPLVDYYQQRNQLASLEGGGAPEEVFERVREEIERRLAQ